MELSLQRILRGYVKFFHQLKKEGVIDKLHSCKLNGKDLLTMSENEMHGIQCFRAILYKFPESFYMQNDNSSVKWIELGHILKNRKLLILTPGFLLSSN